MKIDLKTTHKGTLTRRDGSVAEVHKPVGGYSEDRYWQFTVTGRPVSMWIAWRLRRRARQILAANEWVKLPTATVVK